MPAKQNLVGQVFDRLTVLEESKDRIGNRPTWKCQCECGNVKYANTQYLRSKGKKSCGCANICLDIQGKRFGNLVAIKPTNERQHRSVVWECQCDCGNICYVRREGLRCGDNVSCGCRRESNYQAIKFRENLIGEKYNNLTVIGVSDKKNNQNLPYLICRCDCGNLCEVTLNHLKSGNTRSCGCLENYSIGEKQIYEILQQSNINFKREYVFSDLPNRRYDFAIFDENNQITILVEFDGEQHYYNSNFFKTGLKEQQKIDKEKTEFAKSKNIVLVRIPYWYRDHITLDIILGKEEIKPWAIFTATNG